MATVQRCVELPVAGAGQTGAPGWMTNPAVGLYRCGGRRRAWSGIGRRRRSHRGSSPRSAAAPAERQQRPRKVLDQLGDFGFQFVDPRGEGAAVPHQGACESGDGCRPSAQPSLELVVGACSRSMVVRWPGQASRSRRPTDSRAARRWRSWVRVGDQHGDLLTSSLLEGVGWLLWNRGADDRTIKPSARPSTRPGTRLSTGTAPRRHASLGQALRHPPHRRTS
jgi:hypothetical protein